MQLGRAAVEHLARLKRELATPHVITGTLPGKPLCDSSPSGAVFTPEPG